MDNALESEAVHRAALQWARGVLEPLAEAMDREDRFPDTAWATLAAHGYTGAGIPEEWGGSGGDLMTSAQVGRALARVSPAFALSYGAHLNLCAHNILRHGTQEQRRRYLPGLASGQLLGAMALTEPDAGSDAVSIRTRAVPVDGGFQLRGSKMFITNAPVADLMVVYAKTRPDAGKDGISAFIVETAWPGVRRGAPLDKMGMRGSPTGEVWFADCFVPAGNLLGEENGGVRVMMGGLDAERAFYALCGVGVAEEALDRALAYARTRRQFGRPIADFQLIQAKLAEMYARTEASRLLALAAVEAAASGRRASREAAAALFFAAETAHFVVDQAVQVHGGYGYLRGTVVERLYRDVKLFDIGAGTQEMRRLIMARELLGQR